MNNMLTAFIMGAGMCTLVGMVIGVSYGRTKFETILYTALWMAAGGIGSMILCSLLGL